MSIFTSILVFVITVLALVTVHEYGHFWVARRLGFKIQKFSIGFGKAIIRWHGKDGVEYVVAILPLGGYVKMLDEHEGPVPENQRHLEFNQKPVWARFAVVAAGPITNILFAVFAFWLMLVIGVNQVKPIVGEVIPNSIAAQAGMVSNQEIVGIDGSHVVDWQDIILRIVERMGDKGVMQITTKSSNGNTSAHKLNLSTWENGGLQPQPLQSLGFQPFHPVVPAIIGKLETNGPASNAGIKVGDKVLSVDGKAVKSWKEFVVAVQNKQNRNITLSILRDGKTIKLPVKTKLKRVSLGREIGYIGVQSQFVKWPEDLKFTQQYSVLNAWYLAWEQTWQLFNFNAIILWKLLRGQISLASLGGPITIYRAADVAFAQGLVVYLSFLGLVSVMLAFVNVLPIPGLDGGHLLYFIIEAIRRKPLTARVQTLGIRLGIIFLVIIMVQATINDVMRLFN